MASWLRRQRRAGRAKSQLRSRAINQSNVAGMGDITTCR